ncbi:MAG: phage holin family protein [Pirellulales bacterium]|nr:phage holin family protein [Pirellulales bacterium]
MSEPEQPLLSGLQEEIGSLAADLKQMATLRWQLARLELEAAAKALRRLVITGVVVGVMTLSALPILAVALAQLLHETQGISFAGWLLILGGGLLFGGILGGYLAWRRFRRRFSGIEQTLEELREDLVWLQQWTDRQRPG